MLNWGMTSMLCQTLAVLVQSEDHHFVAHRVVHASLGVKVSTLADRNHWTCWLWNQTDKGVIMPIDHSFLQPNAYALGWFEN